jgi:hypothetical protein
MPTARERYRLEYGSGLPAGNLASLELRTRHHAGKAVAAGV